MLLLTAKTTFEMFSTSGYFNDIVCPFFLGGVCDRPHCHFKHALPVVKEKPAAPTYIPTPLHKLRKKEPPPEDKKPVIDKVKAERKSSSSGSFPEYTPTPLSELKKSKEDSLKKKSLHEPLVKKKIKSEPNDDKPPKVKKEVVEEEETPTKISPKSELCKPQSTSESLEKSIIAEAATTSNEKKRVAHQPSAVRSPPGNM